MSFDVDAFYEDKLGCFASICAFDYAYFFTFFGRWTLKIGLVFGYGLLRPPDKLWADSLLTLHVLFWVAKMYWLLTAKLVTTFSY